jgi:hypothetical protein
MKFDFFQKENNEYLGSVFLFGVATAFAWTIALYDLLFNGGHGLLWRSLGVALPFFGVAAAALFVLLLDRAYKGSPLYWFIGSSLIGLALISHALISDHLILAIIMTGAACVVRGILVSMRQRIGKPLSNNEHWGFVLLAAWLFVSILGWNLLAAIRAAAILLILWSLIPRLSAAYLRFGERMDRLFVPGKSAVEAAISPEYSETYYQPSNYETYAEEKEAIRQFIRVNWSKWTEITFQPTIENEGYITHILDKPLDVHDNVFFTRETDLTAALRLPNQSLIITLDAPRNAFLLRIAREDRQILFMDQLLEKPTRNPETSSPEQFALANRNYQILQEYTAKRPYGFVVGLDPFSELVLGDLENSIAPHMLVAGTTGSGKTVFLHTVLLQLLSNRSPKQLNVLFADPGQITQAPYEKIPHLWRPLTMDASKMLEYIKELVEEREKRLRLLAQGGADDRRSYLNKYPEENFPIILLVIDEAQTFTSRKELSTAYLNRIYDLLCNGRKVGIHIMLGLQRPMADTLGNGFKDNLGARVILRLESADHSENVLGDGNRAAARLRDNGDGLYKVGGDVTRFQGYFIPKNDHSFPNRPWVGTYIEKIIKKWGQNSFAQGPSLFSTPVASKPGEPLSAPMYVSPQAAAEAAEALLASKHLPTITNAEWLVLRGLEMAFANVPNVWRNPPDWALTSDALMLHVRRATPENYINTSMITAAFISETLEKLSNDKPGRSGKWAFNRNTASPLVAKYRQINQNEWSVMRGVQAYMAGISDRPEKIEPADILTATQKIPENADLHLTTQDVDDILRRLIGDYWVNSPDGEGEWVTASTVVKTLINNLGVLTPKAAPAAPVNPRPSVQSVATRAPKDSF